MAETTTTSSPDEPAPSAPCPNCGYCPHCKRAAPVLPYWPVNPYPISPWWGYAYPTIVTSGYAYTSNSNQTGTTYQVTLS